MTLPTVRHTHGCDSGLIQFEAKRPRFAKLAAAQAGL